MSVVFVVSPSYLEATFVESKKYNFDFQGYGSFHRAISGVVTLNALDCLGFAYVGVSLPEKGSEEYKDMLLFFKRCDRMTAGKKVVLIVLEGITSAQAKILKTFSHLRFVTPNKFDCVTDSLLNRNLFGSLLLDNYAPYEFGKGRSTGKRDFCSASLSFCPVVNQTVVDCLNPVERLTTLQLTLEHDAVLRGYVRSKSSMEHLRRYLIIKMFMGDGADRDVLAEKRALAQKCVDELKSDPKAWCMANYVLQMIKKFKAMDSLE